MLLWCYDSLKNRNKLEETIEIINEIAKYGLNVYLDIEDKETELEENLIKIYSKYFVIKYEFDDNEYPEFDKVKLPDVIKNVKENFPQFGFYHKVLDCHEISDNVKNVIGDATDDLSDIIFDLLEIKWRAEHNSKQDALWFFELIFRTHTQQHIISLLDFMKSKNG